MQSEARPLIEVLLKGILVARYRSLDDFPKGTNRPEDLMEGPVLQLVDGSEFATLNWPLSRV